MQAFADRIASGLAMHIHLDQKLAVSIHRLVIVAANGHHARAKRLNTGIGDLLKCGANFDRAHIGVAPSRDEKFDRDAVQAFVVRRQKRMQFVWRRLKASRFGRRAVEFEGWCGVLKHKNIMPMPQTDATDIKKPNGFRRVRPADVSVFASACDFVRMQGTLLGMSRPSYKELESAAVDAERRAAANSKRLAKIKEQAKLASTRTMSVALGVGGAAAMGFVAAKYPGQWMGIDKELLVGGGLLAAGLLMPDEKMSDPMLHAGAGILSAYAYNRTRQM